MTSVIYKIRNLKTYKLYVGSAIDNRKRFYEHKRLLNLNKHPNRYLQFAWNKYGEANFVFEIIEVADKFKLLEREQFWIDWLKCVVPNGYNLSPTAGSKFGFSHSEETKIKISKAASNISEDTRRKMKVHIFSDET